MIKIKLQETARKHGLTTAYTLQKALDCSPTMASRLWNGKFKQIGMETIGSLCDLFDCQPNDLFENQKTQSGNTQSSKVTQTSISQTNKINKSVESLETPKKMVSTEMLSTVEVAKRLGLSRKSVNDYINKGLLSATKGKQNHNFVSEADLLKFEEARKTNKK